MTAWSDLAFLRTLGSVILGAVIGTAASLVLPFRGVRIAATALGAVVFLVADLVRLPARIRRHRAQGRLALAARELQILSHIALTKPARKRARLALASVLLAFGRLEQGGALLKTLERDELPAPLKATWDTNHAYYLLATHRDPQEAFRIVDQLPSQPDPNCPPAFPPTRGLALLAMGRTMEAVTDLTRSLAGHDLGAWESAEANYHLAQAWRTLGHPAYAADHLLRTCNACTTSPYAEKASQEIAANSEHQVP